MKKLLISLITSALMLSNITYIQAQDENKEMTNIQPVKEIELPAVYDARQLGYMTKVKSQYSGTCWATTITQSAEANAVKKGLYDNTLELDATEYAYRFYNREYISDPLMLTVNDRVYPDGRSWASYGSNLRYQLMFASNWASFKTVDYVKKNGGYENVYPYDHNAFKVENMIAFCDGSVEYDNKDYQLDIDKVKRAIYDYGAVGTGQQYTTRDYECNKINPSTYNHCITLVGWDDTISKDLFKPVTPSRDGAWLVKDSFGGEASGYYYLSYESTIIDAFAIDTMPNETYDYNYFYDGGNSYSLMTIKEGEQMIKVFKAQNGNENEDEYVSAIHLGKYGDRNATFSLQVYTNLKDPNDPLSGTPAFSEEQLFNINYLAFMTIPLKEAVKVEKNSYYSIVVTLKDAKGYITTFTSETKKETNAGNPSSIEFNLPYEQGRNYRLRAFTKMESVEERNQRIEITSEHISNLAPLYLYEGRAVEPDIKVIVDGKQLKRSIDYSVTYVYNNGDTMDKQAKIIIHGINDYIGYVELPFDIYYPDYEPEINYLNNRTYDGTNHFIGISNIPKNASITYQVNDSSWSNELPLCIDANNYTINYRISHPNYDDKLGSITLNIPKQNYYYNLQIESNEMYCTGEPFQLKFINVPESMDILYSLDGINYSEQSPILTEYNENGYKIYYKTRSNNYEEKSGAINIVCYQQELKPKIINNYYEYDGNNHTFDVIDVPKEASILYYNGSTYVKEKPIYKEGGTYYIQVKVQLDKQIKYLYDKMIIEYPKMNVKVDDIVCDYDNSDKQLVFEGIDDQMTIQYRFKGEQTYQSENPKVKQPGIYEIEYKIEKENYQTIKDSATIEIKKLAITNVVSSGVDVVYDGNEYTFDLSYEPSDAMVTYSINGVEKNNLKPRFKDVGRYVVTYRIEKENYETYEGVEEVIIRKAYLNNITSSNKTVKYNGEIHCIDVKGIPQDCKVLYKLDYSSTYYESFPSACRLKGTYKIDYVVVGDNYYPYASQNQLVITYGEFNPVIKNLQQVYDGNPKQITIENVDENTIIKYRLKGESEWSETHPECIEKGSYEIEYSLMNPNYIGITRSVVLEIKDAQEEVISHDIEVLYDGNKHQIVLENVASDASIYYRLKGSDEWSSNHPTCIDANEYEIEYKVSKEGYVDIIGCSKIIIHGLKMDEVIASKVEVNYDGTPYQITLENVLENAIVSYRLNESDVWSSTHPTCINAGVYTIYYKVEKENYETIYGSQIINIKPKAMKEITSYPTRVVYDGEKHNIQLKGYYQDSIIEYRLSDDEEYRQEKPNCIDAGTYQVQYRIQTLNYETVYGSEEVIIDKAEIKNIQESYRQAYYNEGYAMVYVKGNPSGTKIYYRLSENDEWSTNNFMFVEAGEHIVYYKVEGNNYEPYYGDITTYVNKRKVSAPTVEKVEVQYDGNPHTLSFANVAQDATIKYRLSENEEYSEIHPECIKTGTYTIYYEISKPWYESYYGFQQIIIYGETMDEINVDEIVCDYDGLAHELIFDSVMEGATIKYRLNKNDVWSVSHPKCVDVGVYQVYYLVEKEGYTPISGSQTITINGKTMPNFNVGQPNFNYDGKPHQLTIKNLLANSVVKYRENTSDEWSDHEGFIQPGTYKIYYQVSCAGYKPKEGYTYVHIIGPYMDDVQVDFVEVTYDGKPHQIEIKNVLEGATIQYALNKSTTWSDTHPTCINPGEYKIKYLIQKDGYHNLSGTQTIVIQEAKALKTLEVTSYSMSKVYDASNGKIQLFINAFDEYIQYRLKGSDTWSMNHPRCVDVGVYEIEYQVFAYGYQSVSGVEKVVITPATQNEVSVEKIETTYDGKNHPLVFKNLMSNTTIYYRLNDQDEWSTTHPTCIDVGSYDIQYKIEKANYDPIYGSQQIVIHKENMPQVNVEMQEVIYDGNKHELVFENLPKDATLKYRLNDSDEYSSVHPECIDVGEYIIHYQIQSNNYETYTSSQKIIIKEATMNEVEVKKVNVVYDGKPHRLALLNSANDATISYRLSENEKWSSKHPECINVGTYQVYYRIEKANYKTIEGSQEIVIRKASMDDVTVAMINTVYDGNQHELVFENVLEDVTIEYRLSASDEYSTTHPTCIDVGVYAISYRISKANYESVEGIQMIKINKASMPQVVVNKVETLYDGNKHELVFENVLDGAMIEYRLNASDEYSTMHPTCIDVGVYAISYRISKANYESIEGIQMIKINKASMPQLVVNKVETLYDGNKHELVFENVLEDATIKYRLNASDEYSTTHPTCMNAGTYTIYYQISKENYETISGSQQIIINKASMPQVHVEKVEVMYDGKAHQLVFENVLEDATIKYRLNDNDEYTMTHPTCIEAGIYNIQYLIEKENYETISGSQQIVINKKDSYEVKVMSNYVELKIDGSGIYEKDDVVELSASTFTNYEFIGWSYDLENIFSKDITLTFNVNENKTIYAMYQIVMPFIDVPKKAWFYTSVESAFKKGLMTNTGKGKEYFEPDIPISRGMVATVLYRMANKPKVEFKASFSDVTNPKLWYASAITWASTSGVVSGYKDGRFAPDDNITRQDLAIMLRNYAKANGLNTNVSIDFSAFKDGNKVASYASSAVQFCISANLMSGAKKADGVYLNPTDNATRAECAKMFSMLDDLIKNQ